MTDERLSRSLPTAKSEWREWAWLSDSQSDLNGMKSGMKTDANRRALLLTNGFQILSSKHL